MYVKVIHVTVMIIDATDNVDLCDEDDDDVCDDDDDHDGWSY